MKGGKISHFFLTCKVPRCFCLSALLSVSLLLCGGIHYMLSVCSVTLSVCVSVCLLVVSVCVLVSAVCMCLGVSMQGVFLEILLQSSPSLSSSSQSCTKQ